MTSINSKLGLRPAGRRSMMKLPKDRRLRSLVTSAQCPKCSQRGATLLTNSADAVALACTWCHHRWDVAIRSR